MPAPFLTPSCAKKNPHSNPAEPICQILVLDPSAPTFSWLFLGFFAFGFAEFDAATAVPLSPPESRSLALLQNIGLLASRFVSTGRKRFFSCAYAEQHEHDRGRVRGWKVGAPSKRWTRFGRCRGAYSDCIPPQTAGQAQASCWSCS